MAVVDLLIKYTIACVYGVYYGTLLIIGYVSNPTAFKGKIRETPPKCLTDSTLWKHGYLSLKGIKIHYVEKGDRTKPLMLFVHGFPEFWYSWRYQLKEFSKDYWTVAIDMRGYGDSEKPSGVNNYSLDHLSNDIKQVVEALGHKKFILVAHDWGGVIAWDFVKKHYDMLERYIILDAPYTPIFIKEVMFSYLSQFLKSWYIFFYMLPYLPELLFPAFDFPALEKVFRRKKPKELSPISDEDIEAFKYTFGKPGALTPPINYYRHLMTTPSDTKGSNKLDIDVPGLLLFGEFDDFLIPENVSIAKKYVKNLQVQTIEGGNHFVQQDEPDRVNNSIRQFLKK